MIDVNVNLSRWPFRRLATDEPAALAAALRKRKVTQAWAGTLDGIFHKDMAGANARLANDCRHFGEGLLIPFGSINPKLPDWEEDLRRCHEVHQMPGIRLHPNYHGYDLQDPVFADVVRAATGRRMIVQLALRMEDERTQHPLMRVPAVEIGPLAALVRKDPQARLVVLNADHKQYLDQSGDLAAAGNVCFDLSMVEGVGGAARLARQVSIQRVLLGSHSPLFYFESAALKVQEAGFTEAQARAVLEENARRLLAG